MSTYTFSPKDPEEVVTLVINFANLLEQGETINSAAVTVEDQAGANQTAMLVGNADISAAPIVRQQVTGGTNGTTYLVRAKATMSSGRVLVGSGNLPVRRGA